MKNKTLKASIVTFSLMGLFSISIYANGEQPKNPDSYYKTSNKPLLYGAIDIVIPKDEAFNVKNSMYRIFARDFEDGDLTQEIKIDGEELVNTAVIGEYPITYTVTDSHNNESSLTVKVTVVEDTNIKVKRKVYSNLKVPNAPQVSMNRGDGQDRQHIGLNLFAGSRIRVTYLDGNANINIQNETQRHEGEPVTSKDIPKDQPTEITASYTTTPFVRTPIGNDLTPTTLEIEILDDGITKPLALFFNGDNQEEFIQMWRDNGGYGVFDSQSVTILVGHREIDNLLYGTTNHIERDYTKYLTWWDQIMDFFDDTVGLKLNPENLWDQKVRTKYYVAGHKGSGGAAYYGVSQVGISTGDTFPFFQYNWGGLHEVGHGYQSLRNGLSIGEVTNNILGWYTQYNAMTTDKFGERKNFEGGMRGGGPLDVQEENFHKNRKPWDNGDVGASLYILLNMLDSFEGPETWAKINSWARKNPANNIYNYDAYAKVIAEEYKVNIYPYYEALGMPMSENVKAELFDAELPLVQMAKDLVGDETNKLKEQDLLVNDYALVRNEQIASLNLKGNLTVNAIIDDPTLIEGGEGSLYSGQTEVAKATVRNGVIKFENVPVGVYKVVMPQPKAAYNLVYAHASVAVQDSAMNYTYKKVESTKYDNRMWLSIIGIHYTNGLKFTNNGNGTLTITPGGAKLANSDEGKISEVTIYDEKDQVVYKAIAENQFYFDVNGQPSSTLNIGDGYKIVIYHQSPSNRIQVGSTLTNAVINSLLTKEQTTTYEITKDGFKIASMSDEDYKSVEDKIKTDQAIKEIQDYLDNVTQEELDQKGKNISKKSDVLGAILSLKEEDRTDEYKSLYNKILNGGLDIPTPLPEPDLTPQPEPQPEPDPTPQPEPKPDDNTDDNTTEEPTVPETPQDDQDGNDYTDSDNPVTKTPEVEDREEEPTPTKKPVDNVTEKEEIPVEKPREETVGVTRPTRIFPFTDIAIIGGHWKYEGVRSVYDNNIMDGVSDTLFGPDLHLTRGMFATVLYRLEGSPAVTYTDTFSDVEDGKWYTDAIIWANQVGITTGYTNDLYGTNDNITREQIAKMLYEYSKFKNYKLNNEAVLEDYTDNKTISDWAVDNYSWAVGANIIQGKRNSDGSTRLDPKGDASRAECAALLARYFILFGK